MIVEIAKMQEEAVGDGTTTAVVLAGELLNKAEFLLEKGVHPTTITKGYKLAEMKAQEILQTLALNVDVNDEKLLKKIAITAMIGKSAENNKEFLSDIIVKSVKTIIDNGKVDLNNINIEKKEGSSIMKSILVNGIVIDKEKCNPSMPSLVQNAKIALLSSAIEIKKGIFDSQIQITNPIEIERYIQQEEKMISYKIDKIKKSGATVVFCEQNIDDIAINNLSENKIMCVKRVKRKDMESLSKATGAKIVGNVENLSEEKLGFSGKVFEEKFGKDIMIFVAECKNPKSVTLFIRAGTKHIAEEIARSVTDAIGDLCASINDQKIVGGAGSVEMALSTALHEYASTVEGKEQYAVQAFAEALEIIPHTLAENAGLDAMGIMTKLRKSHKETECWLGINVFTGEIQDAFEMGVIEPLRIKTQALSSATEVAEMILRIDDVVIGKPKKTQGQQPPYDQVPSQFGQYM